MTIRLKWRIPETAAFFDGATDVGTALVISLPQNVPNPTLGDLSLSSANFIVGAAESGTIIGATTGSTITGTGFPSGFTINGAARTWAWDGTGAAGVSTITLTETLAGAIGSPNPTDIDVTIIEDPGGQPGLMDFNIAGNPL